MTEPLRTVLLFQAEDGTDWIKDPYSSDGFLRLEYHNRDTTPPEVVQALAPEPPTHSKLVEDLT